LENVSAETPGSYLKLFTVVIITNGICKLASEFFTVAHFHISLIFASMTGANLSGALFLNSLQM
jgi:hypothetical protein